MSVGRVRHGKKTGLGIARAPDKSFGSMPGKISQTGPVAFHRVSQIADRIAGEVGAE